MLERTNDESIEVEEIQEEDLGIEGLEKSELYDGAGGDICCKSHL